MNDKWEEFKQEVLSCIDVESFCEEVLGPIRSRSGDEITCLCNFHEDTNPSMCINTKTKVFKCQACGKGGSVIDIWMQHKDLGFKDALLDLGKQKGVNAPQSKTPINPPISTALVKKWHDQLMSPTCTAKRWLNEKRGLLDETLVRFQIGWDGERNTIPVHDSKGNIANVRRYNAKQKQKMFNYVDGDNKYGTPARLYGCYDVIKRDCEEVFLTEGEWDRIIAEQNGFAAVTGTAGCKTFRVEWGRFFKGRKLRIVYDCDQAGREAVERILPMICKSEFLPKEIKVIWLPLEGTKDDKDLSDYFVKRGNTAEDFRALVDAAEVVDLVHDELQRDDTIHVLKSLAEIDHTDYIDKRVEVELVVCGETSETFHAPTKFRVVKCSEDSKCFNCAKPFTLAPDDPAFIGVCMSNDEQVERLLRRICCDKGKRPKIEILEKTTVREFFANQRVERNVMQVGTDGSMSTMLDGVQRELVEKKIYLKAKPEEHIRAQSYKARGWVRSHPKTQQVVLLVDDIEALEESFEKFRITDETKTHLQLFKDYTILDLNKFLSERVTRVYKREDLLIGMLLTLCSVLKFKFQEEEIRGWVCLSIIGDSGTAKSQTIMKLSNWVGVGDVFSGLTGTRTGLAYGLREHKQKGWQIKVGRYPANTRKVLIMDEAQEIEPEDLRKIGKAMDEGFLQVDQISSGGYESMTRLIALANPKKERIIDDESFGCESIRGVFSKMMIRRFDICLFASSSDIKDTSVYNRIIDLSQPPNIPLSPEALRSLIFFAWSRKTDQIRYTLEAEKATIHTAFEMGKKFGSATSIPIVSKADFRKTLARLAVSAAILDGSYTDDYECVVVTPEHVSFVSGWLDRAYVADNCSLDSYSSLMKQSTEYIPSEIDKFKKKNIEDASKHCTNAEAEGARGNFLRLLRICQVQKSFKPTELIDLLDVKREWVSRKLSLFKSHQLIKPGPYGYQKTPKFVKWLRDIENDERYGPEMLDFTQDDQDDAEDDAIDDL